MYECNTSNQSKVFNIEFYIILKTALLHDTARFLKTKYFDDFRLNDLLAARVRRLLADVPGMAGLKEWLSGLRKVAPFPRCR
jgi:hypothetical protein